MLRLCIFRLWVGNRRRQATDDANPLMPWPDLGFEGLQPRPQAGVTHQEPSGSVFGGVSPLGGAP
jgi:hypothetical protein